MEPNQDRRQIPSPDAPLQELREFALTYHGYRRIGDLEHIGRITAPVREELASTGSVPEWAGLDLLRASLFFFQRQERFIMDGDEAWAAAHYRPLVQAISRASGGLELVYDEFI